MTLTEERLKEIAGAWRNANGSLCCEERKEMASALLAARKKVAELEGVISKLVESRQYLGGELNLTESQWLVVNEHHQMLADKRRK